ncbi:MAG TPA: hypothetical protein VLI39_19965 [Sedimentisphaerales bacterium]|nr:hypothetical protein [Sedimentisphaerales bacterium]
MSTHLELGIIRMTTPTIPVGPADARSVVPPTTGLRPHPSIHILVTGIDPAAMRTLADWLLQDHCGPAGTECQAREANALRRHYEQRGATSRKDGKIAKDTVPGFECRSETDLPAGIAKAVNAPARETADSLFSAFGDGKFLSPRRNFTPRGKKWRMV